MSAQTGACRFCGQSVMIECEDKLTGPQLEEEATMRCGCERALEYQESIERRDMAKQRVIELFGDISEGYKQPDTVQGIMLDAVDAICDKKNESGYRNSQNRAPLSNYADGQRQDKSRA